MVLEKLSHCLNEDILLHAFLEDLLHLRLVFGLEDCGFFLEEEAHAV